ncbi:MAG: alpha/beta hydrolase, partial [Alphaproteobacteria bacterium]|nr:alpha/beta hydrolase [Alphaproteobacteria bacterium]
ATLATLATQIPGATDGVVGMAFLSPNFRLVNPASVILTWPLVEHWGPIVAGTERAFEASSDEHARFWTTSYPTKAVFPLGASVKAVQEMDHGAIDLPALFIFDSGNKVSDHFETARIAARWGGPSVVHEIAVGEGDDPYRHVIAGDILSPGQTDALGRVILDWAATLP